MAIKNTKHNNHSVNSDFKKFVSTFINEVTHSHEYEDMSQMGEDENDPQEINVGNYQTKYFHVCPGASKLYGDIESKGVDMDMAERSVRLQDALYFIEEHIQRDGYKPERDYVMVAKNIAKNIMKMAEMMGLEKEHDYIQGHIDTIEKVVKEKGLEERVMGLTEENVPTNPSKWSYYKSQAKKKFDVYPSAYANAWAAKQYKAAGGGWKTKKKESVDESINEMDINDPILVKLRAAQIKRNKDAAKKIEKQKKINPEYKALKNAPKIKALKKKRAEIMRDMEQEAEPEGGKIADRYGRELNKIDNAIIKLGGNPMSESVNENADYKYLTQIILDAKPKYDVYYNSSHNVVNIGGVGYDKGDLVKNFNQTPGSSSKIKNNFYHAHQDPQKTKREVEKLSKGKIKVKVGDRGFLSYSVNESVNEGNESDSDMAVDQLEASIKKAQELIAKLRGKGDLEPWVQSLITKAEDYISTVTDYSEVDEYDVETMDELNDFHNFIKEYKSSVNEAEYQGRKVELGKIMQGDVKKFKVYVNNDKGNVVKVNFGQKGMTIKKDNPGARKSFRARMNCDSPGPRWKARYWSCRKW